MRRNLLLPMFAFAVLLLGACSSSQRLQENADEAARLMLKVRPRADLSDITVRHWTSARELESMPNDGFNMWMQIPMLLRLGVLSPEQHDQLVNGIEVRMADIPMTAFAVPHKGLIYVRPGHETAKTILHELSHVLSYRFGYYPRWDEEWCQLSPSGEPGQHWIDLDAAVAAWFLEEGMAVLTSDIAWYGGHSQYGKGFMRAIWQTRHKLEHVQPQDTLQQRFLLLAYGWSRYLVKQQPFPELGESEMDLDLAFAKVWSEFSFTTYQVLFPDENPGRSRLAERFRTRADDTSASGATRVGAFFVREFVLRAGEKTPEEASARVRQFRDDVLLRDDKDALLWIVVWESDAAASWFADMYRAEMPDADVQQQGRCVIVNLDGFDDADAAVRHLLE
jgi:hypothetical protein